MSNLTFIQALEAATHTQQANNDNIRIAVENLGHMGQAEYDYGLGLIDKLANQIETAQRLLSQIKNHHQ